MQSNYMTKLSIIVIILRLYSKKKKKSVKAQWFNETTMVKISTLNYNSEITWKFD